MNTFHADHRNHESKKTRYPPLQRILRGSERTTYHDTEDREPKEFDGLEIQSEISYNRSKQSKHDHTDERPEERSCRCNSYRLSSTTLTRERVSIHSGCGTCRGARYVQENGTSTPPIDGSDIHTDKNEHCLIGRHAERKCDQQGDTHGGRKSWKHTDDDS